MITTSTKAREMVDAMKDAAPVEPKVNLLGDRIIIEIVAHALRAQAVYDAVNPPDSAKIQDSADATALPTEVARHLEAGELILRAIRDSGFEVVPRDATLGMIDAAHTTISAAADRGFRDEYDLAWEAMVAAVRKDS